MEPKNYSTIRSILKKEQGEKVAPYIFKINDTVNLWYPGWYIKILGYIPKRTMIYTRDIYYRDN